MAEPMTPEREALIRILEDAVWPFLDRDPANPGRFWAQIANRVEKHFAERDRSEVERLRAQVAAVKAKLRKWEAEMDEQTRAREYGIAEGLRVAQEDVRAVFGAGDGYCICDSIERPERDCGVAEHRRAALASDG